MTQWNDPNTQAWIDQYEQRAIHHCVDVGDHQVSWRQFGEASGEPLLLIHGGHGSWMHWARNIDALAQKFSLFVVDLPGYGDSSDPHFGEFGDMIAVTAQSITQLLGANTPFQLSGFSFGGLVSANLAAHGLSVKSLALLGPGGHGGSAHCARSRHCSHGARGRRLYAEVRRPAGHGQAILGCHGRSPEGIPRRF